MTDFKPGDRVDITIKGALVTDVVDDHRWLGIAYDTPDGRTRTHGVHLEATGVSVERVTPAEWPPQPGDLWSGHDGRLWFAVVDPTPYANPLGVKLVSADGDSLHKHALGDGSGCTLVRREAEESDR